MTRLSSIPAIFVLGMIPSFAALADIVWQASTDNTCKPSLSGEWYQECQPVTLPLAPVSAVPEPKKNVLQITDTKNTFIKEMSYTADISYSYVCKGRHDTAFITYKDGTNSLKEELGWGAEQDNVTFVINGLYNKDAAFQLTRNSRGFSLASKDCRIEVHSFDTYLTNPTTLRNHIQAQVTTLVKLKGIIKELTKASDLTSVQKAIADSIILAQAQVTTLESEKTNLEVELSFAIDEAEKTSIQEKIDDVTLRLNQVRPTLESLQAAATKLAIVCAPAAEGQTPACTNFLSETLASVTTLKDPIANELKDDFLPWIKAELDRLAPTLTTIRDSLTGMKNAIEQQL